MASPYASIGFSLSSAGTWGIGDFAGGIAARRSSVFSVVVAGHGAGFFVALLFALASPERLPGIAVVAWGLCAGVIGSLALSSFYHSLAIGKVGLNAPVTGVLTAALPVIFGIASQGSPGAAKLAGFALALAGIVLISRPEKIHGWPPGMGFAIVAGFGFGGFLIALRVATRFAAFWPLVAVRIASSSLMVILSLVRRQRPLPSRENLPISVLAGICDTLGTVLFIFAAQRGRLDVAAVLASQYPAETVILVRVILIERDRKSTRLNSSHV